MSYQTKEMAIGYILKAFMDDGTNTKELRRVFKELHEVIREEGQVISNNATESYLHYFLKENDMENRIDDLSYSLDEAFDYYTVEEADSFYQAFIMILRV